MSTKIKICGLTTEADIDCVNQLMPEYIGFVFAKKSRRYLADGEAEHLRDRLRPGITPVGVFVNEDPERIASLLARGVIEIAQLHGQEDEAYVARLKSLTDRPLFQAFSISGPEDVARAERSGADCILLDQGAGGTGKAFDWSLAKNIRRPWFLAGGLDCQNIGEALGTAEPWGVDVSSGVETEGKKDPAKIRSFVAEVRNWNRKNCFGENRNFR